MRPRWTLCVRWSTYVSPTPPGAGASRRHSDSKPEIDVVDGVAVSVLGIAVDQVDERVADALDRRDVEFSGPDSRLHAPGAALDEPRVRRRRVAHAEGHRAHARAMPPRE